MKLTVFNGSPRGMNGNTEVLIKRFLRGFSSVPGNTYEVHYLHRTRDADLFREAFQRAENVLMAFPMYVHAMPGVVMNVLEGLEPAAAPKGLGFLVQFGFPEARQSRWLTPYLERLVTRLGCRPLGIAVLGSGEGIRIRPYWMNRKLFRRVKALGRSLGKQGVMNPGLIRQLRGPETLGLAARGLLTLLSPVMNGYWDKQLKESKALDKSFDRPFEPGNRDSKI